MEDIKLEFLGGAGEIGGENCILISIGNTNIMIDRGQRVGKEEESKLATPKKISALLLTHGHLDHCGLVPDLFKSLKGSYECFMSSPTYEFAKGHWAVRHKFGNATEISQETLYDILTSINQIESGQKFLINGVSIKAVSVGHILGSFGYHLTIGDKKIFVTGDFSMNDTHNPLVNKFDTSFLVNNVDTLIINATYAGVTLSKLGDEINRFSKDLKKFIEKRRQILIPVFSIDRAQKIYYILRELGLEEYVYIDGGAKSWFSTYNYYGKISLKGAEERFITNMAWEDNSRENIGKICPLIVIAPAGMMLKGSSSRIWSKTMIDDENSAILLTGYQEPGTYGDRLLKAYEQKEKMGDQDVKAVVKKYSFSGHARSEEIAELIRLCNPSKSFFTHCNPDNIRKFLKDNSDIPGELIIAKNNFLYNI